MPVDSLSNPIKYSAIPLELRRDHLRSALRISMVNQTLSRRHNNGFQKHHVSILRPYLPMVSKTPPPAVLVLGLPLAGIASLRSALETLGHKDIYGGVEVLENPTEAAAWGRAIDAKYNNVGEKWPLEDLDVVLAGHDVVMDMPCTAFAEDLIAAYPKVCISILGLYGHPDTISSACFLCRPVLLSELEYFFTPFDLA